MSFSYAYNPKVSNPHMSNDIPQMRSDGNQSPFYFGGSQIPIDLGFINTNHIQGKGINNRHSIISSKTFIPKTINLAQKRIYM